MKVLQIFGLGSLVLAWTACGGSDPSVEPAGPEVAEETSADALHAVFCRPAGPDQCLAGESCLSVNDTQAVCATNRCIDQGDCRDNYVCRLNHCIRVEEDPTRMCPRGSVEGRAECREGSHPVLISRDPVCSTCERDPPPVCPRGSVEGRAECPDGAHSVRISREPMCSICERDPPPPVCPRGSVEGRAECPAGSHVVQTSRDPICSTCERDAPTRPDRCGPNYHPVARGDCRQILGYFWDGRVCNPLSGCTVTDADGLFRTGEECARAFAECAP